LDRAGQQLAGDAVMMSAPRLSAEQHRALTFLTTAALNGATQSLLAAHGFSGAIISGMVNRALVTLSFERFRAGGKMIKVRMVRITGAGRDALAAGGSFHGGGKSR
jgi:hypothetical protein